MSFMGTFPRVEPLVVGFRVRGFSPTFPGIFMSRIFFTWVNSQ